MHGPMLSLSCACPNLACPSLASGWAGWVAPILSVLLGLSALGFLGASLRLARRSAPRRRLGVDQLRLAQRDALTGLGNHQGFVATLADRLRASPATALLLLDIDGFAAINASHGHRAADDVLVAVADRLRTLVADAFHVGRLGGDTFGVLLEAGSDTDIVEAAALRLVRALAVPLRVGVEEVVCTASLGAAIAPGHGSDTDALLHSAQTALDAARRAGGGTWRLFEPERETAARTRSRLAAELRDALASGQVVPNYQPVVDLGTGAVAALEVLARWNHPVHGLLTADTFVDIAEAEGLAAKLTERLMRQVLADMRDLPPALRYAFNVLPGQLREIIAMVREPPIWPEGVFDPARIIVEVTERALLEEVDVMREVMHVLHQRGTQVVLDDFGAGTASLAHMRTLPFDAIKIDGAFVAGVMEDERSSACVRAALMLGRSLRIDVIAEGVESEAVSDCLAGMGCRFGQGFFYGRPVPARELHGLLRRIASTPPGRTAAMRPLVCGGAASN